MDALKTFKLSRGEHSGPKAGTCLLEAASLLGADKVFTDHPKGVCQIITEIGIRLNDSCSDEFRDAYLSGLPYRLVGTVSVDVASIRKRLMIVADFLIRHLLKLIYELKSRPNKETIALWTGRDEIRTKVDIEEVLEIMSNYKDGHQSYSDLDRAWQEVFNFCQGYVTRFSNLEANLYLFAQCAKQSIDYVHTHYLKRVGKYLTVEKEIDEEMSNLCSSTLFLPTLDLIDRLIKVTEIHEPSAVERCCNLEVEESVCEEMETESCLV